MYLLQLCLVWEKSNWSVTWNPFFSYISINRLILSCHSKWLTCIVKFVFLKLCFRHFGRKIQKKKTFKAVLFGIKYDTSSSVGFLLHRDIAVTSLDTYCIFHWLVSQFVKKQKYFVKGRSSELIFISVLPIHVLTCSLFTCCPFLNFLHFIHLAIGRYWTSVV